MLTRTKISLWKSYSRVHLSQKCCRYQVKIIFSYRSPAASFLWCLTLFYMKHWRASWRLLSNFYSMLNLSSDFLSAGFLMMALLFNFGFVVFNCMGGKIWMIKAKTAKITVVVFKWCRHKSCFVQLCTCGTLYVPIHDIPANLSVAFLPGEGGSWGLSRKEVCFSNCSNKICQLNQMR